MTGLPTPRLTATITPPTGKSRWGAVIVAGYTPPPRAPDPADEVPLDRRARRNKTSRPPSRCTRCKMAGHIASNAKFHPRPL